MLDPAPTIRFAEARDGYRFAVRHWDVAPPRAHVVFLHGVVSHGGWYLPSGSHLAGQGFAVHMLDRRGSGLNAAARGDVDRWQTWPQDVEDYIEAHAKDAPRILLGVSWGGTLAAAVARRRPDLLDGVGLLCPGLFSRKAANAFQRTLLRTARAVGARGGRVAIPLQDPALFTGEERHQRYIEQDPLNLWRITIRFAYENLQLTQFAVERPEEIRVPALAMLAGRDPITVNQLVREFVERIDSEHKQVIEYPEASHTLEFEPDRTQYFADLAAWCGDVAVRARGQPMSGRHNV